MGDGTEPRGDDVLALAEELQVTRQENARLRAENKSLKEAWVRVSNFDRFDFRNAIEKATDDFLKAVNARGVLNAAKTAGDAA